MFDENDEPAVRLNVVMAGNKLGGMIRRDDLRQIISGILKEHLQGGAISENMRRMLEA